MVDTCQANTMYSKIYSPNVLATGSSELGENSYSVRSSTYVAILYVINPRLIMYFSMRTALMLAWPSSTVSPTTYYNTWKVSIRLAMPPCKTWYVVYLPPTISSSHHLGLYSYFPRWTNTYFLYPSSQLTTTVQSNPTQVSDPTSSLVHSPKRSSQTSSVEYPKLDLSTRK